MEKIFLFSVLLFVFPGWVEAALSPEGALVLAENGTIYEISKSQKRGFPSAEVFFTYGHEFRNASKASSEDLALPDGPLMVYAEGSLVKGSGSTVYIITEGVKRPFTSAKVFLDLGYSFANVIYDSANVLENIRTGTVIYSSNTSHPAGTLINHKGAVFVTTPSARKGIPSLAIFSSYGYKLKNVVPANVFDVTLPVEEIVVAKTRPSLTTPLPPPALPPPREDPYANKAPSAPTITGVTGAYPQTTYTYTVVSTDPNGDTLTYTIDWGDASAQTKQVLASGNTLIATHFWTFIGLYVVKVTVDDGRGGVVSSSHDVRVDSDTTKFGAALTVLAPNGAEKYVAGQEIKISWRRNWIPQQSFSKVDIYHKRGALNQLIKSGVLDNSYTWIPSGIPAGEDYKIEVVSQGTGGAGSILSDESDNFFSLTSVLGATERRY